MSLVRFQLTRAEHTEHPQVCGWVKWGVREGGSCSPPPQTCPLAPGELMGLRGLV